MSGFDQAPLIGMLFIVFLLSMVLVYVCKRIGIPEFIGPVVAGGILANAAIGSSTLRGWLGLDFSGTTPLTLNAAALTVFFEIGLIFLVFTVGLQIRPHAIRGVGALALRIALLGVVIPFALGAAALWFVLGESNIYAILFIGTALAASSVGIVAHLLRTHGLVQRIEGHRLLAAALFEDLIALVLLAIVLALAGDQTQASTGFFIQVAVVVGFAVAFVVAFLRYADRLVDRWVISRPQGHSSSPEARAGMLAIALLVCLGVAYVAESFQLAAILGALFAGIALSRISDEYGLERSFDALNTFIVPFFFVYIGLYISVGGVLSVGFVAILITALALVGKPLAGWAEVSELGRAEALSLGTGLIARGEVAIIIAVVAADSGLLPDPYLGAIVVMAIVTTLVGPILFNVVRRRIDARAAAASGEDTPPTSPG